MLSRRIDRPPAHDYWPARCCHKYMGEDGSWNRFLGAQKYATATRHCQAGPPGPRGERGPTGGTSTVTDPDDPPVSEPDGPHSDKIPNGMNPYAILDPSYYSWSDQYPHKNCRKGRISEEYGWCSHRNKEGTYFQMDLGHSQTILGVATKGRGDSNQYVKIS